MPQAPLVISHRTQAGTMPENTLLGIDAALEAGVDGIELDVRATADGVVVLVHDEALQRVTGDPRTLADVTHAELAELRVLPVHGVAEPQPIPTLAEVFERVAGRAIVVVEVKEPGLEDRVAWQVRYARAAAWTWIWAFDPATGRACRRVLPEVPVSLNYTPGSLEQFGLPEEPVELCVQEGFAAVSWHHRALDAALVTSARRRGLATYCWSPDDLGDIERVSAAGVDAICSDFPDRVRAVIARETTAQDTSTVR